MESSDAMREKEATALREWFSSQKKFGTWAAMERALKITKDYLHLIKNGKRRAIDPELRNKLYQATNLDVFKPITAVSTSRPKHNKQLYKRKNSAGLDLEKGTRNVIVFSKEMEGASEKATKIKKLLIDLADELEFFKQEPESVRETFRRIIPGEDIGYITTLLRALYDEDQFQRWLLFSEYKLRSKEKS